MSTQEDLALISPAARRIVQAQEGELNRLYDLIVQLQGRLDAHLREQHPECADTLPPLMPLPRIPTHYWTDDQGLRHVNCSGLGVPIGTVTVTWNDEPLTMPIFDPGPDEPMLTEMAKAKQRANLVAAAEAPAHTDEADFQHWLTYTYSGFGMPPPEVVAYIRAAWQASKSARIGGA